MAKQGYISSTNTNKGTSSNCIAMSWPTVVTQGYQLRRLSGKQSDIDIHTSVFKANGFVCLHRKALFN